MKAKVNTIEMNAWDAFVAFMQDIYGDSYFETASSEQVKWEWEEFSQSMA